MKKLLSPAKTSQTKGIIETLVDGEGIAWLYHTIGKRLDKVTRFISRSLVKPFLILLPVKRNKIVFRSNSRYYDGEAKIIAERIRQYSDSYELVWLVNSQTKRNKLNSFPLDIRLPRKESFRALYDLYTARVIIDTEPHRYRLFKKKEQFYIQTSNTSQPLAYFLRNFSQKAVKIHRETPDICIIGNDFEANECQKVYSGYPAVLNTGHPRNIELLKLRDAPLANQAQRNLVSKRHGFTDTLENLRFALFVAPSLDRRLNFESLIEALKSRFGGEWNLLIFSSLPKHCFWGDVFDAHTFISRDLLLASDVLITDGTGWTLDYVLSGRPLFLLELNADDRATLIDSNLHGKERLRGLGVGTDHSLEGLLETIRCFDEEAFTNISAAFLDKHQFVLAQSATKNIAEVIRLICRSGIGMEEIYSRTLNHNVSSAKYKLNSGLLRGFTDFANGRLFARVYAYAGRFLDKKIAKYSARAVNFFYQKSPIKRDKIVFWMCHHKYGGNSKYITEEILRRKLPYELVWVVRYSANPGLQDFPKKVRVIDDSSMRSLQEIATAKVWVDDTIHSGITRKKKGQYFIQTWHGSLGIKRFAGAWDDKIKAIINKITDVCISNSSFETNDVYKTTFWENVEIREYGHPRNDIFFWPESRQRDVKSNVFKQFGIPEGKKLVLYAPTFREIHFRKKNITKAMLECYDLPIPQLLDSLGKRFGDGWIFVERLHNHVKKARRKFPLPYNVIDASEYADIQELMLAADVLISDYSSCMFDFMLSRKPVFIYAKDLDKYSSDDRGFYYPIESTPFPISTGEQELLENVGAFDFSAYISQLELFLKERGCVEDGHASEKVVDLIEKIIQIKEDDK